MYECAQMCTHICIFLLSLDQYEYSLQDFNKFLYKNNLNLVSESLYMIVTILFFFLLKIKIRTFHMLDNHHQPGTFFSSDTRIKQRRLLQYESFSLIPTEDNTGICTPASLMRVMS